MINKLSPSTNVSPANTSVQFSWVSNSYTSLYQIKYRKINETTWSDTGRITKSFAANATATHTQQITLSPNETYEWRVRVWNGASGAMSDWSTTETFNTQYDAIGTMKVKVSDSQYEDIRIISPDANAGQERLMVKMTDNQIGQVDTVLSGTGASSVKIKINSTTVKSLVKNMPKLIEHHTQTILIPLLMVVVPLIQRIVIIQTQDIHNIVIVQTRDIQPMIITLTMDIGHIVTIQTIVHHIQTRMVMITHG